MSYDHVHDFVPNPSAVEEFVAKIKERFPSRLDQLRDRLVIYVETMENAVCAEQHSNAWPDCNHSAHDIGRELLSDLNEGVS